MKLVPLGFNAIEKPIYVNNLRKTHHHVIGSSGTGKSKFLEHMMRGDLTARQGFCLIDPHGTLYDLVLKYCAHQVYKGDIILLNLSKPKNIVGFNFFTKTEIGKTSVQADNLVNATLHAWDAKNADTTPTLGRTLKVIYTTILDAGLTLPQVAQLIDFKGAKLIKEEIASKIQNDLIRREWLELASMTKLADFRAEILSLKNRLFPLLTSETLLQFIGIKDRMVNLLDAMNGQKVILVNLAPSDDLSPEQARLFGSLLVNQFFQAARRREKDALGRDPKPYFLYLDEFQNFVSIDLAKMLDEVRKFGLFTILSHQRFGHFDEDMKDAVLTNCKIKTVFGGLRAEDAEMMAKELFIGKLDPMKIKVAIYQTKHWYKYTRDKVYTKSESLGGGDGTAKGKASARGTARGTSRGTSRGTARGTSHGSASGSSLASGSQNSSMAGQSFSIPMEDGMFTGATWFNADNMSLSNSQSEGFSNLESNSVMDSQSQSESYSESESESESFVESESKIVSENESRFSSWSKGAGVADVPVLLPVPYKELSSIQYYTLEEQLLELTQALKLQQQRHCFIELPGQQTQPLLVPFVKDFHVSKKNFDRYIEIIAEKNNAISPEEADRLISQAQQDLLQLSQPQLEESTEAQNTPKNESKPTTPAKKTFLDKIKEANPDIEF
jgi:hypothetical protein